MSEEVASTSKEEETPVLENIEVEEPPEPITRKDPKRVEQGKKLALISKEAKEKKMRERIEKENFSYLTTYGYPLITFVSVLGVAWMMVFGNGTVKHEEVVAPVVQHRSKTRKDEEAPRKSNFESLG